MSRQSSTSDISKINFNKENVFRKCIYFEMNYTCSPSFYPDINEYDYLILPFILKLLINEGIEYQIEQSDFDSRFQNYIKNISLPKNYEETIPRYYIPEDDERTEDEDNFDQWFPSTLTRRIFADHHRHQMIILWPYVNYCIEGHYNGSIESFREYLKLENKLIHLQLFGNNKQKENQTNNQTNNHFNNQTSNQTGNQANNQSNNFTNHHNALVKVIEEFPSIKMTSLTITNFRDYLRSFLTCLKRINIPLPHIFVNSLFILGISKTKKCRNIIFHKFSLNQSFFMFKDYAINILCSLLTAESSIFFDLELEIKKKSLTELHSHLMGLGNADFWVNQIMKNYLVQRRKKNNGDDNLRMDVEYDIDDIFRATNFPQPNAECKNDISWKLSIIQARLLSQFDFTLYEVVQKREKKHFITNSKLVELMQLEKIHGSSGPIESMVRNWFEFLSIDGSSPTHFDILNTYRGHFTPEFSRRFIMKDVICKQCPEVLSILLNTYLHRYYKAGVNYIELSYSANDLIRMILVPSSPSSRIKELEILPFITEFVYPDKSAKVQHVNYHRSINHTSMSLEHISKIDWRINYPTYYTQPDDLKWKFLAAFNRCKINHTSIIKYPVLNQDSTSLQFVQLTDISDGPLKLFSLINTFNRNVIHIIHPSYEIPEKSLDKDLLLFQFADYLCKDSHLNEIYADGNKQITSFFNAYLPERLHTNAKLLREQVIGLDWVGDEFGYPFCYLCHSDVLFKILSIRKTINQHFGIRIHAGEGLIRPSNQSSSKVTNVFKLHIYILIITILKIYKGLMENLDVIKDQGIVPKNHDVILSWCTSFFGISLFRDPLNKEIPIKSNIRIGHGIGFLYRDDIPSNRTFNHILTSFRSFLSHAHIPCELNPTSNHMLVPATFHDQNKVSNNHSLSAFLNDGIPVVLCTDDDGIWAIDKCPIHDRHISVSHEYCEAIKEEDIDSEETLDLLIQYGKYFAFNDDYRENIKKFKVKKRIYNKNTESYSFETVQMIKRRLSFSEPN